MSIVEKVIAKYKLNLLYGRWSGKLSNGTKIFIGKDDSRLELEYDNGSFIFYLSDKSRMNRFYYDKEGNRGVNNISPVNLHYSKKQWITEVIVPLIFKKEIQKLIDN